MVRSVMCSGAARAFAVVTFFALVGSSLSCNRDSLAGGTSIVEARDDSGDGSGGPSEGCPPAPEPSALTAALNEFMPLNTGTLEDETGSFPPWVEIVNTGSDEINLGNVPLSDDIGDSTKWVIPCVEEAVVPPGGFLVVFLDGRADQLGGLHAGFAVPPGAGMVELILNEFTDDVVIDVRNLDADASVGRFPDGDRTTSFRVLSEPTPGAPNAEPTDGGGPQGEFIRADANDDTVVDISDLHLLLRVLFRSEDGPDCADRLDVNDDGDVNVSDATFLRDSLFLDGPPPPPPFPQEGEDPTADDLVCPP